MLCGLGNSKSRVHTETGCRPEWTMRWWQGYMDGWSQKSDETRAKLTKGETSPIFCNIILIAPIC